MMRRAAAACLSSAGTRRLLLSIESNAVGVVVLSILFSPRAPSGVQCRRFFVVVDGDSLSDNAELR